MTAEATPPRVLSIAGSDSGGGAGIQADMKAFASCGAHGMTAITAITAQSTTAVSAVEQVAGEMIVAQVRAVAEDIGIDAVKIGMLGRASAVAAVAEALEIVGDVPVVLDPVMVAESGARLLDDAAVDSLVGELFPRATVVTPNLAEAMVLAGAGDDADVASLARSVQALGPRVAIVTGGHRDKPSDVYFDGAELVEIEGERRPGGAAHGSGCTHSSVLAARLAFGDDPLSAARAAKEAAARAVARGHRGLGAGAGPVDVLGLCDH